MIRNLDPQSSLPLFEQVAAEIRRAIALGEANPGERLPPARDIAAVLDVNTNTVLRAPSESSATKASSNSAAVAVITRDRHTPTRRGHRTRPRTCHIRATTGLPAR